MWSLRRSGRAVVAVAASSWVNSHWGSAMVMTDENPGFPKYTRAEVRVHNEAGDIWVTYKKGVYDITSFIENHPGGVSKIMLAAGQDLEPFWRIYQQHLNSKLPRQLLDKMQVGELDDSEPDIQQSSECPYAKDPVRHPALKFHNNKPCNAELPPSLILDNWITPNDLFFIRHHHPVPHLDMSTFKLTVEGRGVKPIVISMDDLRHRFPKAHVTTTIQCGGNRRDGFNHVKKTSGIGWGFGAISNARYSGVYLRDVLMYSGLLRPDTAESEGIRHIQFQSVDGLQASIPIEKALSPYGDVLLAFEMNGAPLPIEHGGPLRVIVPGHVGVRNVKWVTNVVTSDVEATGPWQRGIAYKGFAPGVTDVRGLDLSKIQSVQEQPVTSAIVEPMEGERIPDDEPITVRGFAWAGGGRGIVRVDVSCDGGLSWHEAELQEGSEQNVSRAWAWTFWELELPVPDSGFRMKADGAVQILCKATDASYNCQPESPGPIWNFRGLNNNSWHRVSVKLEKDVDAQV